MQKKKKKKSHYKTGVHISPKCVKPINYRSGWELVVAEYLDKHPDVISYEYESLILAYKSNLSTGRIRKYYPDFFVTYKDGTRLLVEVKRQNQVNNITVQKKAQAAIEWTKKQPGGNVSYQIWTESIEPLKTLIHQAKK